MDPITHGTKLAQATISLHAGKALETFPQGTTVAEAVNRLQQLVLSDRISGAIVQDGPKDALRAVELIGLFPGTPAYCPPMQDFCWPEVPPSWTHEPNVRADTKILDPRVKALVDSDTLLIPLAR